MAVEVQQIIEFVLAIILPPLAVFIHDSVCDIHVAISIILCFLGWIPAIIHALWYCFFR
ncbi:Protein F47B7.1 [Aphelenchoides avenae]|nr:Protein F47B7.1 [Aphelenchus avenae]